MISRLAFKLFVAMLSSLLLLSSPLAAATTESTRTVEERIADLERQVAAQHREVAALHRELSTLKRDLATGPVIEVKATDPASAQPGGPLDYAETAPFPQTPSANVSQPAAAKPEVKPASPGLKISGDVRTRFEPT